MAPATGCPGPSSCRQAPGCRGTPREHRESGLSPTISAGRSVCSVTCCGPCAAGCPQPAEWAPWGGAQPPAPGLPASVTAGISRLLGYGALGSLTTLLEGLSFLQLALENSFMYPRDMVLRMVTEMSQAIRAQAEALVRHDDELRRLWEIADIALAVVRGAVRAQLLTDPRGFDAIDDLRLPGVAAPERRLANGRSTAPSSGRCTTSASPTRTATRAPAHRRRRRRCAGRAGASSPIGARSSGRCTRGWGTSSSLPSTRC